METALVSVQNARVLDVGPISAEASGELIRRVFDVEPGISDRLAARIHGRTGGNPYFVGEILKALVDSGSLYLHDGTWLGWEVDDLDLPDSVGAAVAASIGELSPAARQVAHVLAVAGTRATHELFGAVADLEEDVLLGGIDELRAKQLVEESAEGSDIVYRFSHPLIQEVLYSEIGLARARSLHRTVGEALEGGVGSALDDRTHQLAHHFSRAGGSDTRVIRYLSAAGREALSRRADREAVAFLGDALSRAAGDGGDGDADLDVLSLREDLARALQRSGDYGAAAEHWQVALALTLERGEDARAARLHGRIGQGAYFRGQYDDALAAYELGLERAVAAKDPVVEAHLRLHKGNALQSEGRAKEAQEVDPSLLPMLFELGLMGIEVPEEFGGADSTFFTSILVVEELSRIDPSVGTLVDVQNTLVINALKRWGNDELNARYFPLLATEMVGAYALSEAGSGSDAFALTCRATQDGDDWLLTGQKLWITNGSEAATYIVFATVDPEAGYKGITAFMVDRDMEGFTVGKKEDKLGIRASSTTEIVLDNVRVPGNNGPRSPGPHAAVRAGAGAVRPAHRRVPGRAVPAGRRGDRT